MIVYNVKRRWFTMKADAEAYRKAEGLTPGDTHKLEVSDRDDLAGLLNALCGLQTTSATQAMPVKQDVPKVVLEQAAAPDFVPAFLVKAWQADLKRQRDNGQ